MGPRMDEGPAQRRRHRDYAQLGDFSMNVSIPSSVSRIESVPTTPEGRIYTPMPTKSSENATDTTDTTTPPKRRRDALNESRVWQVYARRKYEEPLHEIGNVMADDVELCAHTHAPVLRDR